jgi:uncharacterized membrane protein
MTTTGASSTGLDPHLAAALAYLAGPFSGATVLLAERTNEYVRFHAWQAIVGLGSVALLAFVFLGSAFLALFVSPVAFTVLYRMAAATAVAWLVLWMVCLFQAFTGREWRMPVVGRFAARKSLVPGR